MFLRSILAALALSGASGWGYAQCSSCTTDPPIKIEVGTLTGGTSLVDCHSAGSNFSVSVSGLSGDVLIHIYDCAATTRTHNIGVVTISGYSSNVTSVAVMVAGESESWDEFGTVLLDFGCVNFGGLDVSDPDTLKITRASISAYGNIERNATGSTPDIHVNQVVFLGARHTGGSIPAHVLADGGTLYGSGNTVAIRHVRAWDTISGSIIATDKDIGEVRVVGSSSGSPGGIQGSIIADQGVIGGIWTSGPIGSPTNTVTITAGTRIGRITCRDDATSGDSNVLSKPFYANVEASSLGVADTTSAYESSFSLIETDGNYVGNIHLYELNGLTRDPVAARGSGRHGIFVGGKFEGGITVDRDYSHADMIARSFRGTITVGKYFEGCIVAVGHETPTDDLDGTIGAISIGNNSAARGIGLERAPCDLPQ